MAEEELQVIRLRDDFYRDGFYKVLAAVIMAAVAIAALVGLSIFIYFTKPAPINFSSDDEWRILAPVPLKVPYITAPDLLQWASEAISAVFTYDFISYTEQLQQTAQYFTNQGWQNFLEQISEYANFKTVQTAKLFISASPAGAPFIINQGLYDNERYSWWIQMPITLTTVSAKGSSAQTGLVVQALVVRVPTLNNLSGVGIANFIVKRGGGDRISR